MKHSTPERALVGNEEDQMEELPITRSTTNIEQVQNEKKSFTFR
jgi:hypothetical protein